MALHALGVLFPAFPESKRWRERAAALVEAQLAFQVRQDGSHFEQSSYYHVYALDFFLFYYLIAGRPNISNRYWRAWRNIWTGCWAIATHSIRQRR